MRKEEQLTWVIPTTSLRVLCDVEFFLAVSTMLVSRNWALDACDLPREIFDSRAVYKELFDNFLACFGDLLADGC
jgi:hypothetical protein